MDKKRRIIYLAIVLGSCYVLGFAALFTQGENGNPIFSVLQKGFTALPVLAAVITRRVTKDKTKWNLSLKVWKKPLMWAFCAIVPGFLITVGAVLYFVIYPDNYSGVLDYESLAGLAGATVEGSLEVSSPIRLAAITILISAIFVPIQLLELGEEIGWREYLLPKQIKSFGIRKAVLINSFLWGTAHFPLIYFGFNYTQTNPLAPWSNMALMLLVCMSSGIICSYVTISSGNCMYAAIVHGAINIIGEVPVFLSVKLENGLLGPNPTGLIGMSGMIICAVILFVRLGKIENKLNG